MPRNTAEMLARAAEIGAGRERLGRDPRARSRVGEAIDGGLRGGGIVALLRLDHFGGDVTGAGP